MWWASIFKCPFSLCLALPLRIDMLKFLASNHCLQVSVVDELGIPVKFVGVGEGVEDLQPFDAEAFVDAIFARGLKVGE